MKSGNLAVIVGVGPGLGSALTKRCLAESMRVAAVGRSITTRGLGLEQYAQPGQLLLHDCDAAAAADIEALFARCDEWDGPPDLLIYNVGTFRYGSALEMSAEALEQSWRAGCLGGFLAGQAAARRMVPVGRGSILFTGATASLRGSAGFLSLAVPKFGVRAIAQSMAREFAPRGVHVAHIIIDGQISAEIEPGTATAEAKTAKLHANDIAEAFLYLHRQRRNAWTFELDLRPCTERF